MVVMCFVRRESRGCCCFVAFGTHADQKGHCVLLDVLYLDTRPGSNKNVDNQRNTLVHWW